MNAMVFVHWQRHYEDRLAGLADIFFSPSKNDGKVRVVIHRIRNVNRGLAAHTYRSVSLRNVAVPPTGEFVRTSKGRCFICGRFYGTDHA